SKALQAAYEALNRNDIPGFLQIFAPDIERIEPADFPGPGIYKGLEAVEAHVRFHRARWAEGGCEPEGYVVTGDRIVVFVHVRVRLKDETEWREGHLADGFEFRGDKAVLFRTFTIIEQALEWA